MICMNERQLTATPSHLWSPRYAHTDYVTSQKRADELFASSLRFACLPACLPACPAYLPACLPPPCVSASGSLPPLPAPLSPPLALSLSLSLSPPHPLALCPWATSPSPSLFTCACADPPPPPPPGPCNWSQSAVLMTSWRLVHSHLCGWRLKRWVHGLQVRLR